MEHKTIKNKLSKTGFVILYSFVFFGIGCVIADVSIHRSYLAYGLIALGGGWILLFAINRIDNHFKSLSLKQDSGAMFCFKCNTIHDYPNSICKFESKV